MSRAIKVGIVVGELSGDQLGMGLMKALLKIFPDAEFEGIGGPQMNALGCRSFHDMERLAVMGLVDPLKRLPELLGIKKQLVEHFIQNPPDVFIGIDAPDFNLRVEQPLHRAGIKTVHYVSPSVWAWRKGRVKNIAKSVNLMLTLFPFEAEFYRENNVPVEYVGHPLADEIPLQPDVHQARSELEIKHDALVLGLLPGSRSNEVKLLGPDFLEVAVRLQQSNPNLVVAIPAANKKRYEQLKQLVDEFSLSNVVLVEGRSHLVLQSADFVLMTSGTTTLEAMLMKKPMVVAYRQQRWVYHILKPLIKVPYFSLPNLLANEKLVPEFLQYEITVERLYSELKNWLDNPQAVKSLVEQFNTMHQSMRRDASQQAALAIAKLMGD